MKDAKRESKRESKRKSKRKSGIFGSNSNENAEDFVRDAKNAFGTKDIFESIRDLRNELEAFKSYQKSYSGLKNLADEAKKENIWVKYCRSLEVRLLPYWSEKGMLKVFKEEIEILRNKKEDNPYIKELNSLHEEVEQMQKLGKGINLQENITRLQKIREKFFTNEANDKTLLLYNAKEGLLRIQICSIKAN